MSYNDEVKSRAADVLRYHITDSGLMTADQAYEWAVMVAGHLLAESVRPLTVRTGDGRFVRAVAVLDPYAESAAGSDIPLYRIVPEG